MSQSHGATTEGTARYARRFVEEGGLPAEHFREVDGLRVSSIGLGTYLGDADEETDILYTEAVVEALRSGCNVVDAAINYRFQRSERSIGVALERLVASGVIARDEVVVSTKGGYVPYDGAPPRSAEEAREYVRMTFVEPGIVSPAEMAVGGQHSMAPRYLEHQLSTSLDNLGLSAVDIYYIHNPEGQIPEVGREEFDRRIRAAFEFLERAVAEGRVGRYGVATWNGLRAKPSSREYLSLGRLVEIARDVAGDGHHFRVVQLPYNLAMPEAYGYSNQAAEDDWVSLLDAAKDLGISVFASASLLQSRLAAETPPEVVSAFGIPNAARAALQFTRSTPGVASALVGMKRVAHVRENLALARHAVAAASDVASLFEAGEE